MILSERRISDGTTYTLNSAQYWSGLESQNPSDPLRVRLWHGGNGITDSLVLGKIFGLIIWNHCSTSMHKAASLAEVRSGRFITHSTKCTGDIDLKDYYPSQ